MWSANVAPLGPHDERIRMKRKRRRKREREREKSAKREGVPLRGTRARDRGLHRTKHELDGSFVLAYGAVPRSIIHVHLTMPAYHKQHSSSSVVERHRAGPTHKPSGGELRNLALLNAALLLLPAGAPKLIS